jgi:hypothetical protein
MNIDNIKNWQAETDKYEMRYFNKFRDEYFQFVVTTKKYYQFGRYFYVLHLTQGIIESESEEKIIEILSTWMDDAIEYLIAMGDIKETR